jgi:chromosome segregation ATPase
MVNTGLTNEIKVSELIQSGSLAIKTKNEFGVHVFSGSVNDDGILFGKLTKPSYNKSELEKSIDTVITELIPIEAPLLPETVLKSIYDLALFQIDDLRLEVAQLNDEILLLNNKITEVEIVSESLRVQLDLKDLQVASVENENRQSVAKVQSSIVELQNSIQKATSEAIQRVSLSARNELLDGQIIILNEQLSSAQDQITNLTNTVNSLNIAVANANAQTSTAQTALIKSNDAQAKKKKIICNELYNQGFLPQNIWDADERYGELMWNVDRRLVIGYNMWAKGVVKFMKEKPQYTKYIYFIVKPWTEHMAYEIGELKQDNWVGKMINYIGKQYSYWVYDSNTNKRKKSIWQLGI